MKELEVRCLTLGPTNAGKTTLVNIFREGDITSPEMTIGIDYTVTTIPINDEKIAKIRIIDSSGMERFKTIIQAYFRNINILLLVFDLSDLFSFQQMKKWVKDFRREYSDDEEPAVICIGMKCDKIETVRPFTQNLILDYIEGCRNDGFDIRAYFELSNKLPDIKEQITQIIKSVVLELEQENKLIVFTSVDLENERDAESGCCLII